LLLLSCSNGASVPDQTDTCSSEPPPADGKPTVALGRQVDGPFQPLVDGDVLQIVHGPQGGQHVYVVVRLYASAPGGWIQAGRSPTTRASFSTPPPRRAETSRLRHV
jgi:hypothetical protein